MAKIIEEIITIKLSKIVKDSDADNEILSDDQAETLHQSLPELIESVLEDPTVIVEMNPS